MHALGHVGGDGDDAARLDTVDQAHPRHRLPVHEIGDRDRSHRRVDAQFVELIEGAALGREPDQHVDRRVGVVGPVLGDLQPVGDELHHVADRPRIRAVASGLRPVDIERPVDAGKR